MISKELLCLVTGHYIGDVIDIYYPDYNPNELYIKTKTSNKHTYNLDTLGRLCKEWCLKQGHTMNVQMSDDITLVYLGSTNTDIQAPTELEAIIKATESVAKVQGLI